MPTDRDILSDVDNEPVEGEPLVIEGAGTPDELEAVAAARFGARTEPATEPTEPETPAAEELPPADGGSTEPPAPTPTVEDTWSFDDGVTISREQARSYAEFERFLSENPDAARIVYGLVTGESPQETPAPPAAPPSPQVVPDDLDLDDPVQARLWNEMQQLRQAVANTQQLAQSAQEIVTSQVEASSTALLQRARASYQQQHNLSEDDMTLVAETAGKLNVLPSLMAPVDPTTGMPRKVDPLRALETAFELAAWNIPHLREAQIAEFQEQARESTTRKKKLTSLGGSSGSVPRQQNEVPTDPKARREAMTADIAAMLNGSFVQPEE